MDFDQVDFISNARVRDHESKLMQIQMAAAEEYTDVEKSDAFESLGTVQFYNGDYAKAVTNLENAIDRGFHRLKTNRSLTKIKTMLGMINYRTGQIEKAELYFLSAIKAAHRAKSIVNFEDCSDIIAIVLSNLALVRIQLKKHKDAVMNAREALEVISEKYKPDSEEFLNHQRILLAVFIQLEDFSRADLLLTEAKFPEKEKLLLSAGIKYARGENREALKILTNCLEKFKNQTEGKEPTLETPDPLSQGKKTSLMGGIGGKKGNLSGFSEEEDDEDSGSTSGLKDFKKPIFPLGKPNKPSFGGGLAKAGNPPFSSPFGAKASPFGAKTAKKPGFVPFFAEKKAPVGIGLGEAVMNTDDENEKKSEKKKEEKIKNAYVADFNNAVWNAALAYNMSIVKHANEKKYLSDAISIMEEFVRRLSQRRHDVNLSYGIAATEEKMQKIQTRSSIIRRRNSFNPESFLNSPKGVNFKLSKLPRDDPYLDCKFDDHPAFMDFERYYYPIVTLSTLLIAHAESSLMLSRFSKGLEVESGHIAQNFENPQKYLYDVDMQLKESLGILQACLPQAKWLAGSVAAHSFAGGSSGLSRSMKSNKKEEKKKNIMKFEDSSSVLTENSVDLLMPPLESIQNTEEKIFSVLVNADESQISSSHVNTTPSALSLISSVVDQKSSDLPDISLCKDKVATYRLLTEMNVGHDVTNITVSSEAKFLLQERYKVELNLQTGIVEGDFNLTSDLNQTSINLKDQSVSIATSNSRPNSRGQTGSRGRPRSGAGSRAGSAKSRNPISISDEDDDEHGVITISDPVVSLSPINKKKYNYQSNKHDPLSLRAEIMPLVETFGRDDVSAWVYWALSASGGMGFGFFGFSCPNPDPVKGGFNVEDIKKQQPSHPFLNEVRNRLQEVEKKLHPVYSGIKTSYRWGQLEKRVIVCFLLLKVTMQMNLIKEVGEHLIKCETICAAIREYQFNSQESLAYTALAARHRADYEEWVNLPDNLPDSFPEDEILVRLVKNVLPYAKKYYTAAKRANDIVMQRDALKRLINIYNEIRNLPLPDLRENSSSQQTSVQLSKARSKDEDHSLVTPNLNSVNDSFNEEESEEDEFEVANEKTENENEKNENETENEDILGIEIEVEDIKAVYESASENAMKFLEMMKELGGPVQF